MEVCSAVLLVLHVLMVTAVTTEARMNVLFLVADDMRTELGVYQHPDFPHVHPNVRSPNLDQLASTSLLLRRAHSQDPTCNPSRSSLLTGRRPETTHIYRHDDGDFREVGGDFCTIPQYFKESGYHSVGMGKVFHRGFGDDPPSWSENYWHAPNQGYWSSHNVSWQAVTAEEREETPLSDEQVAERAIEKLRELADGAISGEQPFFLAAGFYKPHLPFTFPEEYGELYPLDEIIYPRNPHVPYVMPQRAWWEYHELRDYYDIAALEEVTGEYNTSLPDDVMMDLRRAYASTITYVDALIGTVLHELDVLGLANNTIVSFFGDHGWHLGEHSEWTKFINLERASHAPMMVRIPGVTTNGGIVTEELTEFVDLFPTLVEAAGMEVPPVCPEDSTDVFICREGDSMMPLISDPADPTWKKSIFIQVSRWSNQYMGYSMRTDRYRYSEWVEFNYTSNVPDWDASVGVELYDHHQESLEDVNLADDPAYEDIVEELSEQLRAGWREAARN